MQDESFRPAGYCPHCGYAMDPGTCPECGRTSFAQQLATLPYWIERRRRLRSSAVTALIVIAFGFGWYIYLRVDCLAVLPTGLLMRVPHHPTDRLGRELWQRFDRGTLTAEQADMLFAKSISTSQSLVIRSPYPAGCAILARYTIQSSTPDNRRRCEGGVSQVFVDGHQVRLVAQSGFTGTSLPGEFSVLLEGLSVGEHEIVVHDTLTYHACSYPLELHGRIVIENKPVSAYVRPVWSPELAEQVRSHLTAVTQVAPDRTERLLIRLEPTPIAIASKVKPDPGGKRDRKLICKAGSPQIYYFDEGHHQPTREPPLLELRPDAQLALESGFTEYFNGVIRWDEIPVEHVKDSVVNASKWHGVPATRAAPPTEQTETGSHANPSRPAKGRQSDTG